MNKKGMTLVELIVTFTLAMVIVVFLVQIIVNLTKIYNNNALKTNILNKQSIISNQINKSLLNKNLVDLFKCGDNCYNFIYSDATKEKLEVKDNKITFASYTTLIPNATVEGINLDIIYGPTLQENVNNAILNIRIPIKSSIDYNFDINIVYQFNTNSSNIDEYFKGL